MKEIKQLDGGQGSEDQALNHGPQESETIPASREGSEVVVDKLTDVYYSRTSHEEDQPVHLLVDDYEICHSRCTVEYGNPCQSFCPANVYEMVNASGDSQRLQINASNCVHCKTCDIMDPYQIITWVPPEGGGGPDWTRM